MLKQRRVKKLSCETHFRLSEHPPLLLKMSMPGAAGQRGEEKLNYLKCASFPLQLTTSFTGITCFSNDATVSVKKKTAQQLIMKRHSAKSVSVTFKFLHAPNLVQNILAFGTAWCGVSHTLIKSENVSVADTTES